MATVERDKTGPVRMGRLTNRERLMYAGLLACLIVFGLLAVGAVWSSW
jgi:hypothetical protein